MYWDGVNHKNMYAVCEFWVRPKTFGCVVMCSAVFFVVFFEGQVSRIFCRAWNEHRRNIM